MLTAKSNNFFKINDLIKHLIECREISEWSQSVICSLRKNFSLTDLEVFLTLKLLRAYQDGASAIFFENSTDVENSIDKDFDSWTSIFSDSWQTISVGINQDWAKKQTSCTNSLSKNALFFFTQERIGFYSLWQSEQQIFDRLKITALLKEQKLKVTESNPYNPQNLLDQLLLKKILFLCGGPGSGKSTLISGIVKVYAEMFPEKMSGVRLIAPTARAAQRLQDVLMHHQQESLLHGLQKPSTVHHFLNLSRHPFLLTEKPSSLEATLVVVDEASMLPNESLRELLHRMPRDGLVLLVGDGEQLPSIEIGGIFQAVHRRFSQLSLPKSPIWELTKTHRLETNTLLAEVTQSIRSKNNVLDLLDTNRSDHSFLWSQAFSPNVILRVMTEGYDDYFAALSDCSQDHQYLWKCFSKFRILTPGNEGDFGTKALNKQVIAFLKKIVWQKKNNTPEGKGIAWMVLKNLEKFSLCNGQIALGDLETSSNSREHSLWFPEKNFACKKEMLTLAHFKAEEIAPAFAMTVHKAQGSEFEEVLIVISKENAKNLSRKWLYTALTRAKKRAILIATREDLETILSTTKETVTFFDEFLLEEV